jgi:SPP1 gp7 family putative phage head morphogenesis protein
VANIYDVAQGFRRALLRRERAAAVELVQAYGAAYERLSAQLDKLLKKIEAAKAVGETVDQAWLLREQRYFALINQVLREIGKFADITGAIITDQQRQAVNQAMADSQRLLIVAAETSPETVSGEFNRINKSAVENMVGFLSDGSPPNSRLNRQGPFAASVFREELTDGVIQGRGSREIAREIKKRLYKDGNIPSGQLYSILRLVRTETLRAYRETFHQTYERNPDVLEGWYWLSALSSRTCRACIALHGTFHQLGERMASHIQCRCTQVPGVKGVDPGIQRGADWFDKQPASIQKEVLDKEGEYEAYKSGRLKLEDFVGLKRSAQWGDSYKALSLERALAGEGQFPREAQKPVVGPLERPPIVPVQIAQVSAEDARNQIILLDKRLSREILEAEREFLRLSREYGRSGDESTRIRSGDARQRIQDLKKNRREQYLQILSQEMTADFETSSGPHPVNVIEGLAVFRRLIGDSWLKGQSVKVVIEKPRVRANYDMADGIHVSKSSDIKTIIHELGHWLEDKERTFFAKITEFLDHRTKNDNVLPLKKFNPAYKKDEKTKPDKFLSPYMGKQYYTSSGQRLASEILSMGLEYFYDDPAELAKEDPEYFDFIYDLVRGR